MQIKRRDIAVCIILSIITCGIYGIYWMVVVSDDTNIVSNYPNPTSGGMVILLTIVTCGIYGIYWQYKQGEKLDAVRQANNIPTGSLSVLYLILSLCQLSIVSLALMQNELNQYANC